MYNHHGQTLYTPVFPTPGKSNPLAKSLSHLHLALASIPAELAPPSRPPSPGFNSRRQVVYDNVRAAYNAAGGQTSHGGWTQVYRLVDMTCTRSRFKKSATRVERKDPEKDAPWILAETEEEWAEWEKAREQVKSRLRRTDTEVVDQQGHPSASGASSKQVNLRDKVASWKAQVDRSFHEDEGIVHEPKSSNPATTRSSQPSSTKKRASPLDFPIIKPSTLNTHRSEKAKGKAKQKPSKPAPKLDILQHADLDGCKSPAVEVQHPATSDPNRKPPSEWKRDTSKPALIPLSFSQAVTSTPKKQPGAQDGSSISVDTLPPFSPPLEAGPSRMPPLGLTTPESQEAQRAAARKRFRPPSPPTAGDNPVGLTDNGVLPSAKRQKTTLLALPTTRSVPPPPLSRDAPKNLVTPTKQRGVFGSGHSINRAKGIPVRPLGAAEGFEDVDDMEVMGRVTPKRRERSLTPLLASSHKVMPRPRPASRKSSPLKKTRAPFPDDIDDDDDLIPGGSPKAYFSSPASSTSSTSAPRKKGPQPSGSPSLLVLGHSNPNFTMNPEAFVPLFTSTQNGPEGDGPGGGGGRALSRKGTGGSAGFFKFNSQFDVDKNVDETVALLERDVDADNWFVDLGGDMDITVEADD